MRRGSAKVLPSACRPWPPDQPCSAGIAVTNASYTTLRDTTRPAAGGRPAARALGRADDGRPTVRPAAMGVEQPWRQRVEHHSPRWTTRLAELPVVRASPPAVALEGPSRLSPNILRKAPITRPFPSDGTKGLPRPYGKQHRRQLFLCAASQSSLLAAGPPSFTRTPFGGLSTRRQG